MTRADYDINLKLVERRLPTHPLLRVLRGGWSDVNVMYMEAVLEQLEALPEEVIDEKVENEEGAFPKIPANDPVMIRLQQEKSRLFGERAKLSNKFHDCETDDQRAFLSDEIQAIQGDIERVKKQIRNYELGGKLPEPEADGSFQVPGDPYERVRKLDSLRSSESRYKRELEGLAANPERNKRRIGELEVKIREKRNKIIHVETAIKQASGHI